LKKSETAFPPRGCYHVADHVSKIFESNTTRLKTYKMTQGLSPPWKLSTVISCTLQISRPFQKEFSDALAMAAR
jgi:hypothetical protein